MDLRLLKPGHRVRTSGGAEAEVLAEPEDGSWVRVRYLEGHADSHLSGREALLSGSEVDALLGVAERQSWGEEITVILHRLPETEEVEGSYEAITLKGVPHNVSIAGSDPHSAMGALRHLREGLAALGFAGAILVEDATAPSSVKRYEVQVP